MLTAQKRTATVFAILVAALAFYGVLPFFWSLTSGEVFKPDLVRPIAYFFAALFGILFLLRLNRGQRTPLEHRLYLAVILGILIMPVLSFLVSRVPVLGSLLTLIEWAAALALLAGLVYIARNGAMTGAKLAAVIAASLAAFLAPFMPWWARLYDAGILPEQAFFMLWRYGLWLIAGIWCIAAWLMVRTELRAPRVSSGEPRRITPEASLYRTLVTGLVIGLGLVMIGMYNPVGYSSDVYRQETYFGGQLVNSSIVSLPDLNFTLLLGMGLVIFPLLLLLFLGSPAWEK